MMSGGRPSYDEAMEEGRRQYSDVLVALTAAGWPSQFTQTGGMCAAIEVALDDGKLALITDARGPLAWRRSEHRGWAVSVYEAEAPDEWIASESDESGDVEALLQLIERVPETHGGGEAASNRGEAPSA